MLSRERAKASLKRKGWSYRRAATFLGYSFSHFAAVLCSGRESTTLLARIEELPQCPQSHVKKRSAA
jgi:hypothetical protein